MKFKCCLKWLRHCGQNSTAYDIFHCFSTFTSPFTVIWNHITCSGQCHQSLWAEAMKRLCAILWSFSSSGNEEAMYWEWQRGRSRSRGYEWPKGHMEDSQPTKKVVCVSRRIWMNKKGFCHVKPLIFWVIIPTAELSLF